MNISEISNHNRHFRTASLALSKEATCIDRRELLDTSYVSTKQGTDFSGAPSVFDLLAASIFGSA